MSSRPAQKSGRHALLTKLSELGRITSTQTVFLHQAIAQTAGLNATDAKCIDLILRAPGGTLTAGQIAGMSGLTTGAVTHILDRLEKGDFIERRRDTADRRKVLVRVRPERLTAMTPKYEAIGRAFMAVLEEYSDEDLQLICDYLEKSAVVSAREIAKLIEDRRSQRRSQRGLRSA